MPPNRDNLYQTVTSGPWLLYGAAGCGWFAALFFVGLLFLGAGHGTGFPLRAVAGPYLLASLAWPGLGLAFKWSRKPIIWLLYAACMVLIWYAVYWACQEFPLELKRFGRLLRSDPIAVLIGLFGVGMLLAPQVAALWALIVGSTSRKA